MPVFISNRRNRESILADPDLVERAVRKEYGNALHDNLKTDGAIATLVKDEILVWCNQEVDEIPVKIREYNQSWIRKAFDHNEWRDSQKILDSFVRLNWQEPLIRKEIPWKLVDGKTALRRIRKKLHQYKINLSEEMLFNAMVENDYDDHMKRSVDLVYSWLSD